MARSLNDNGAGAGHNSGGGIIDGRKGAEFVKRLLSLEADRDIIGDDIKEVYREAKEAGFPSKHLRQYVKDRRKDPDELQDWRDYQAALEEALGLYMDTPLGQAAAEAERIVRAKQVQRRGRPPKSQLDPDAAMDADLDRIINE